MGGWHGGSKTDSLWRCEHIRVRFAWKLEHRIEYTNDCVKVETLHVMNFGATGKYPGPELQDAEIVLAEYEPEGHDNDGCLTLVCGRPSMTNTNVQGNILLVYDRRLCGINEFAACSYTRAAVAAQLAGAAGLIIVDSYVDGSEWADMLRVNERHLLRTTYDAGLNFYAQPELAHDWLVIPTAVIDNVAAQQLHAAMEAGTTVVSMRGA